ncbi:MAG: ATP synthase F1 subunit gamma [Patescibacteria group bacterium]|nr:ATP synthase F1 subunit gamma [Patescibacteria group bacterium]
MNLREVRKKIKSVNNVKKITKAMQLVSSVKMRKAQKTALDGRAYREALEVMIRRVAGATEMKESVFTSPAKDSKRRELVIFISSNKGLCGSFLTSLDRHLLKKVDYENTDFLTVGKKGAHFLGITRGTIVADFSSTHPLNEVGALFSMVKQAWIAGKYNRVSVVYNKFINTLRFDTVQEQVLPVRLDEFVGEGTKAAPKDHACGIYTIEPLTTEIVNALLESNVEEKIRGSIINSEAAEHSARMIAMKNATENATEVVYNLTLEGNKLRQEKITSELLDMITAKESVES